MTLKRERGRHPQVDITPLKRILSFLCQISGRILYLMIKFRLFMIKFRLLATKMGIFRPLRGSRTT